MQMWGKPMYIPVERCTIWLLQGDPPIVLWTIYMELQMIIGSGNGRSAFIVSEWEGVVRWELIGLKYQCTILSAENLLDQDENFVTTKVDILCVQLAGDIRSIINVVVVISS